MSSGDQNRGPRVFRITVVLLVVLGVEWNIADPARIATDEQLAPLPWAILALLAPLALGAWASEVTSGTRGSVKADLLWGLMLGSLCYVGATLLQRYA